MFNLVILFVATILAFWLSAICGGGASLILIPVLNLILPNSLIPFSLTIGTFTSSLSRIAVFKKHIYWKIFFWFVPFSLPAVLLGAWLIKYANPMYLQWFVAFFLLANTPELFTSKKRLLKEEKKYPTYVLALAGFFAGFISGITGAIGLLFNRFYLNYGLTKEEIIATRAANEIFLHLIKLIIYILLGLYSQAAIGLGITIAIGAVLSSYTIRYILPYISEFIFRKIGYGTMVLSGLVLLVNTSEKIIKYDKITVSTDQGIHKQETSINWRDSLFTLEFAWDDGLEIEQTIPFDELPFHLQLKYNEYINHYDDILIEKVIRFRKSSHYEFYCYLNNKVKKYEFEITN